MKTPSYDSTCIFCKIINQEIPSTLAYEDAHAVAFHDVNPQAPVHVLVVPRQHLAMLQNVTSTDSALLGHLMTLIPTIAQRVGLSERGYRVVCNCRESAGQSVWHLHFHLMGGRSFSWPPG